MLEDSLSWVHIALFVVIACVSVLVMGLFSADKFPLVDKHVWVGGGSEGLGLAFACLVVSEGAHVTIAARNQDKLAAAVRQIETHRTNGKQRIQSIPVDLTSASAVSAAFDQAQRHDDRVPDYVVSCVGGAAGVLGYFTELSAEQFEKGWRQNYIASLWQAREAARRMSRQAVKGKIVIVSSVLGYFGLVGYSAYSAPKHALRGLTDALRQELQMYGITAHCYFPGTIYSPGYAEEEKTKPKITKQMEGADEGMSPEACARALLAGLQKGECHITSDLIGHLFRNRMRGLAPRSKPLLDTGYSIIASIAIPIYRIFSDREVKAHARDHVPTLTTK
ncbi:uncharacterized protein L969DRAFT_89963 [Mixia osmundae IAM 14324]|uniref:3-dehydrosphinganine reductase n=1 Tax=Mixia osmundae (strain CBS 9802 / IAM 14324 / JCM 22182 / KY 12970) TaxID=764103 RepID=G7DUV5_MIXOS|nr:uncharacterized protein L969DRAFT_89963 [Mixia osmundae IAM 14324]KEI37417.1 hypothetical protein L969DRAFT_89963 [Mixia osmundae IAM 14324]GAA94365.1 hypothetical protein E5Q_01016 [Mixia osmundae IAM 14324]